MQVGPCRVDALDLAAVEICRPQRIGLCQRVPHHRAIECPIPALLPAQSLGQVRRQWRPAQRIHPCLLDGIEHLQQQAALLPAPFQRLQQPELQGVVVGVVVLFANQHPRYGSQPVDQLLRSQPLAAAQVEDHTQLGVIAALGALPLGQGRQTLAGGQQADEEKQENSH
ncbi:hypothetical protein D9M70_533950 [compost metagenome]